MKKIVILVCFICLSTTTVCGAQEAKTSVPILNPSDRFEFVGELGVKLGETVTVDGIVVEGLFKSTEGGPNLIVKAVNGKPTQKLIQIPITPYFGKFGEANYKGESLVKCEHGSSYRLRVYETGSFCGTPAEAYEEAGLAIATPAFQFQNSLHVISGDKIDAIVWDPIGFVDRKALLSGIAKNEGDLATIESADWKLLLTGADKWTDREVGKQAEVFGTIRAAQTKNTYRVENSRARLVSLEDQIGQEVALRGRARRTNSGQWWFDYRGTAVRIEGTDQFPKWTSKNHYPPIEITGILEQVKLSRVDQQYSDGNLKTSFIVRRPKWTPVDELLTPELSGK